MVTSRLEGIVSSLTDSLVLSLNIRSSQTLPSAGELGKAIGMDTSKTKGEIRPMQQGQPQLGTP